MMSNTQKLTLGQGDKLCPSVQMAQLLWKAAE